ncbi:SDR family oxidoreductase [Bradyrhizobium liaoningense]
MCDDLHARGTVLLTGAGRGIGRALSQRLASSGYPLILVSRSERHLEETYRLCANRSAIRTVIMDVREETETRKLRDALQGCENLHAVVNNAGIGEWMPFEEVTTASWNDQINTNLRGPFFIIRETLGRFRQQGRGLYVNIGSDSSLIGMPHRAAYNASKHGLVGLTAALRAELVDTDIHASLVYLGRVDTFFRNRVPGDRPDGMHAAEAAEVIAFVIGAYPQVIIEEISAFPPRGGLVQSQLATAAQKPANLVGAPVRS